MQRVAALGCTGLQPRLHGVAAPMTRGRSPGCMRLQPGCIGSQPRLQRVAARLQRVAARRGRLEHTSSSVTKCISFWRKTWRRTTLWPTTRGQQTASKRKRGPPPSGLSRPIGGSWYVMHYVMHHGMHYVMHYVMPGLSRPTGGSWKKSPERTSWMPPKGSSLCRRVTAGCAPRECSGGVLRRCAQGVGALRACAACAQGVCSGRVPRGAGRGRRLPQRACHLLELVEEPAVEHAHLDDTARGTRQAASSTRKDVRLTVPSRHALLTSDRALLHPLRFHPPSAAVQPSRYAG